MVWNQLLKKEIPARWKSDCIGNILVLLKDGTHNPPQRCDAGIPLLTGTMFGENFLDYTKTTYINKEDYESIHAHYQPQEGDIIITKIGTLGNVNYLRNIDLPIAIHCNSALLRFPTEWGNVYPYYMCKSLQFTARLKAIKGQSIQEFASLEKIASILLEIPDVKIITKFNNLVEPLFKALVIITSQIDSLIKQRDELLPLLMNGRVNSDLSDKCKCVICLITNYCIWSQHVVSSNHSHHIYSNLVRTWYE